MERRYVGAILSDFKEIDRWESSFLSSSAEYREYYLTNNYTDVNLPSKLQPSLLAQLRASAEASTPLKTGLNTTAERKEIVERTLEGLIQMECRGLRHQLALDAARYLLSAIHPKLHLELSDTMNPFELWQSVRDKYVPPPDGIFTRLEQLVRVRGDAMDWQTFLQTFESGLYRFLDELLLKDKFLDSSAISGATPEALELLVNYQDMLYEKLKSAFLANAFGPDLIDMFQKWQNQLKTWDYDELKKKLHEYQMTQQLKSIDEVNDPFLKQTSIIEPILPKPTDAEKESKLLRQTWQSNLAKLQKLKAAFDSSNESTAETESDNEMITPPPPPPPLERETSDTILWQDNQNGLELLSDDSSSDDEIQETKSRSQLRQLSIDPPIVEKVTTKVSPAKKTNPMPPLPPRSTTTMSIIQDRAKRVQILRSVLDEETSSDESDIEMPILSRKTSPKTVVSRSKAPLAPKVIASPKNKVMPTKPTPMTHRLVLPNAAQAQQRKLTPRTPKAKPPSMDSSKAKQKPPKRQKTTTTTSPKYVLSNDYPKPDAERQRKRVILKLPATPKSPKSNLTIVANGMPFTTPSTTSTTGYAKPMDQQVKTQWQEYLSTK